jgi:hypothetical protein
MTAVEHVFSIKEAKHVLGTNRYIFHFPEQLRNAINQNFSIGIRSMKVILGPRNLIFKPTIKHVYNAIDWVNMNCNISVNLYSNEDMNVFNHRLMEKTTWLYDIYMEDLIEARYDDPTNPIPNPFRKNSLKIDYINSISSFTIRIGETGPIILCSTL